MSSGHRSRSWFEWELDQGVVAACRIDGGAVDEVVSLEALLYRQNLPVVGRAPAVHSFAISAIRGSRSDRSAVHRSLIRAAERSTRSSSSGVGTTILERTVYVVGLETAFVERDARRRIHVMFPIGPVIVSAVCAVKRTRGAEADVEDPEGLDQRRAPGGASSSNRGRSAGSDRGTPSDPSGSALDHDSPSYVSNANRRQYSASSVSTMKRSRVSCAFAIGSRKDVSAGVAGVPRPPAAPSHATASREIAVARVSHVFARTATRSVPAGMLHPVPNPPPVDARWVVAAWAEPYEQRLRAAPSAPPSASKRPRSGQIRSGPSSGSCASRRR